MKMPDTAVVQHLADTLEGTTEELRGVREELRKIKGRTRLLAVSLFLTVCLIVALVVVRHDQRVSACEKDNKQNQATLDLWTPILARPIQHPGPDATQEEIDDYNEDVATAKQFKETLVTGFPIEDCGEISWL
jgi:hypothetical protein